MPIIHIPYTLKEKQAQASVLLRILRFASVVFSPMHPREREVPGSVLFSGMCIILAVLQSYLKVPRKNTSTLLIREEVVIFPLPLALISKTVQVNTTTRQVVSSGGSARYCGISLLNDTSTDNHLLIALTNTKSDNVSRPISLSTHSKIVISFIQDYNDSSAIASLSNARNAQVYAPDANWTVTAPGNSDAELYWTLQPTSDITLDVGHAHTLLIPILGLKCDKPDGYTNIYVHYENIPDYQDGQFVLSVLKARLYMKGNNIGIGTVDPATPLTIRGNGGTSNVGITQNQVGGSATMEFTTADSSAGQATRLLFRGNNDSADIEFYRGGRSSEQLSMFIEGSNGNVGVGTAAPGTKLDVNGNIYFGSNREWQLDNSSWQDANIMYRGGTNSSSNVKNFGFHGEASRQINLIVDGKVGINTTAPLAPLSIHGSGKENTPNGIMHITNDCILFGGSNNNREINSAQISAGKHVANSLNIVGMSSNTRSSTRKVDIWAEGGLTSRGKLNVAGELNVNGVKPVIYKVYNINQDNPVITTQFKYSEYVVAIGGYSSAAGKDVRGIMVIPFRPGGETYWKIKADLVGEKEGGWSIIALAFRREILDMHGYFGG